MVTIFEANEAAIKIATAGAITISASTVLDTAFSGGTAITGQFKGFSISGGVGDVEKIDFLGTTSSFQNAGLEEKPPAIIEVSGTIVVPGDEMLEGTVFGAGTAASGTHTTYQTGLATRTKVALLLNVDDGTDEVNWAITNAVITEYSPSFTGADGHLEATVTFKCLPVDLYGPQFKD